MKKISLQAQFFFVISNGKQISLTLKKNWSFFYQAYFNIFSKAETLN